MNWTAIDGEHPDEGESANATPAIDAHAEYCRPGEHEWRVEIVNGDDPFSIGRGYADTLAFAKSCAESFLRHWVARQAEALGGGWVSVEERLPERGVAVLAVYVSSIRSDRRIDVMWNGYNGWHTGGVESVTVTHWRPLPPLPEVKENED